MMGSVDGTIAGNGACGGVDHKGNYFGIHSTGFRDLLLNLGLLRATLITFSGFFLRAERYLQRVDVLWPTTSPPKAPSPSRSRSASSRRTQTCWFSLEGTIYKAGAARTCIKINRRDFDPCPEISLTGWTKGQTSWALVSAWPSTSLRLPII